MSKEDKKSMLQMLSKKEYESHRFSDHSWDQGSFSIYFSKRSEDGLIKDLSLTATYFPKREFHFASDNKVLYASSRLEEVIQKVHEFSVAT